MQALHSIHPDVLVRILLLHVPRLPQVLAISTRFGRMFSYEIVVGNSFSICIIIQASSNFYICFLICQQYSHHSSYRAYTKLLLNTSMFLSWLLSPTLTTHTFLSPLGYFRCLLETVVSSTSSMRSP